MEIMSSYKVKIKNYNNIFAATIAEYRKAVGFFIVVCDKEWTDISTLKLKEKNNFMERLTIGTKKNPNPKYDFSKVCYKMPAYLRRGAIQEALGCYSSYKSNCENWELGDKKGKQPTLSLNRNTMPCLYQGGMYVRLDDTHARIKILHKNDWVWLNVELKSQDVNYIKRHCGKPTIEKVPKLKKIGKQWYLNFPFSDKVELTNVPVEEQVVCAVDLGINNSAVCSVMLSNGTVVDRKFISLSTEKDRLYKALGRVRKAQKNGASKTPVLWKHVNDLNTDLSRKTAKEIMDFAILYNVDMIVFEHLDTRGKKKGRGKQKLHLWRKQEIQKIVTHNAHKSGIRISRICAWNTSRLAFDGSGAVERGTYIQNDKELYNYSMCVFPNGKTYHCDLNASYNIGARYFIREILKSSAVMQGLPDETKDFRYGTGVTRTLSTLIRLNVDLHTALCA